MPDFKLPLSGNVTQTINPWTWLFSPVGSQIGLFNINLGTSSDPAVEDQILSDVASYGKQLGRIEDALTVLIKNLNVDGLSDGDKKAIRDLTRMIDDIQDIKAKHIVKSSHTDRDSVTG